MPTTQSPREISRRSSGPPTAGMMNRPGEVHRASSSVAWSGRRVADTVSLLFARRDPWLFSGPSHSPRAAPPRVPRERAGRPSPGRSSRTTAGRPRRTRPRRPAGTAAPHPRLTERGAIGPRSTASERTARRRTVVVAEPTRQRRATQRTPSRHRRPQGSSGSPPTHRVRRGHGEGLHWTPPTVSWPVTLEALAGVDAVEPALPRKRQETADCKVAR
jgi:hypothetical protein